MQSESLVIPIGKKEYSLEEVHKNGFREQLEHATLRQMKKYYPGLRPAPKAEGDHLFYGKVAENGFSLFQYHPESSEYGIKILAQGTFREVDGRLEIKLRYALPLRNLLLLLLFSLVLMVPFFIYSSTTSGALLFVLILITLATITRFNKDHMEKTLDDWMDELTQK